MQTPPIVFEDYYLLVCNKPPGLSTEMQRHGYPSLESQCLEYLRQKFPGRSQYFLRAANRLDRVASGIVIFAKTHRALVSVQSQIANKEAEKQYIAVVQGICNCSEATLEHWLLKDPRLKKSIVVKPRTPNAKRSVLHYKVIEEHTDISLLHIRLETGRYHQVRCQMAAIHCPVINDVLYGGAAICDAPVIALHARSYVLAHPASGQVLHFRAALPSHAVWNGFTMDQILKDAV